MHKQSNYCLPKGIAVAKDIQSKYTDECDDDNSSNSRKSIKKSLGLCFHYLNSLVKPSKTIHPINAVISWNIPIALRNIVGKNAFCTRTNATSNRNAALIIDQTKILSRCLET